MEGAVMFVKHSYRKPNMNIDVNTPLGRRIYKTIMETPAPTEEEKKAWNEKARRYEKELLAELKNAKT